MPEDAKPTIGRWLAFVLTLLAIGGLFLMAVRTMVPEKYLVEVSDYEPWSEEVLEAARGIPVQSGGRVKPLQTYAGYKMLGMRGDRRMKIKDGHGEKVAIEPTAWMLDALFRPNLAMEQPTFRVEDSEVLKKIGLKPRAKRDRYSYKELSEGRSELLRLGAEYQQMLEDDRELELDLDQQHLFDLARQLRDYETLLGYFSFARSGVTLNRPEAEGGPSFQRVSTVMGTADIIRGAIEDANARGQEMPVGVRDIMRQVFDHCNAAKFGFVILPPADPETEEWVPAGTRIMDVIMGTSPDPAGAIKDVVDLENLVIAYATEPEKFGASLAAWRKGIEGRVDARGELSSVKTVLIYTKGNWFFVALFYLFLPSCLFVVLSWLSPRSQWGRVMTWLTWGTSVAGLVVTVIGITLRSVIMNRPPVGNLYDTMPYIAAGAVLVVLVVELITRRGLALGLAPILGFAGLTMARLYEVGDSNDPMDPLLAVLRSNYWLTIHVLTITFGYAAGLVTAGFGHIYVFLRIFNLDGGDKSLRRMLTRITYGCFCFTLLLSLVGTVLGGIWANDSWGRFWGWDPKENGALMIVIWALFVLHARMGGILREWGLNLAAMFTAMVVTFSWWHVNLLGVGLHSYGFSGSKKTAVFSFYGIELLILLVGIGFMIWFKSVDKAQKLERARLKKGAAEEAGA